MLNKGDSWPGNILFTQTPSLAKLAIHIVETAIPGTDQVAGIASLAFVVCENTKLHKNDALAIPF